MGKGVLSHEIIGIKSGWRCRASSRCVQRWVGGWALGTAVLLLKLCCSSVSGIDVLQWSVFKHSNSSHKRGVVFSLLLDNICW